MRTLYWYTLLCATFLLTGLVRSSAQGLYVGGAAGIVGEQNFLAGLDNGLGISGWTIAARGELAIIQQLGFRLEATYSSIERRIIVKRSGTGEVDTADYSIGLLGIPVNIRLNLGNGKVRPYVFGGTTLGVILKAANEESDGEIADSLFYNPNGTLDLGVGVLVEVAPKVGVNLEGRYSLALVGLQVLESDNWHFERFTAPLGVRYQLFSL